MSQSHYIEITIPALPPGINQTYLIRRDGGLALTNEARAWDKVAALIVGTEAGKFNFEPDLTADYQIIVRWWGGRHDADAHLKLVQDCITRKLGFDDRQIKTCVIQRCPPDWGGSDPEGVEIYLFKAIETDWINDLCAEGWTQSLTESQRRNYD